MIECAKEHFCVCSRDLSTLYTTKSIDSVVACVRGDLACVRGGLGDRWCSALEPRHRGGKLVSRPGPDEPVFALSETFYFIDAIKVWGKGDDV